MKLLGKAVLIKPDSNPARTRRGLLLSPTAMDKYVKGRPQPGTVIGYGPECENVTKGTRCLFPTRNASVIVLDDMDYYLIEEDRITYIGGEGEKL